MSITAKDPAPSAGPSEWAQHQLHGHSLSLEQATVLQGQLAHTLRLKAHSHVDGR